MCILQVSSALLLVIWAAREVAERKISISLNPLFVPLSLLAVVVAAQLGLPRTEYWYGTWVKALQWMSYGILFFVTTQALRGTNRLRNVGLFLALFGVLVALFAIIQEGTTNGQMYWIFPTEPGTAFYGPYPNHAHFAGLMEMLFPVPLVLALGHRFKSHARLLLFFGALIIASSIFLSRSLGGILAFAGELAILAILLLQQRGSHRSLLSMLVLLVALCGFLVILQPIGLQQRLANVTGRSERANVAVRLWIVRDSMRMVRQRPLLGYGLGTFVAVFPSFRTFYTNFTVNAAHNDYVQTLVETGTIGFGLTLVFIVLLYKKGARNTIDWASDCEGGMALAALVGCGGVLIHSLCDFNLQIPANAALFFVLAGVATARHAPNRVFTREGNVVKAARWWNRTYSM